MHDVILARKMATLCCDHLGGIAGEAFFKFMQENRWIRKTSADGFEITEDGYKKLELFGISIERLFVTDRQVVAACIERHNSLLYEHTGAYLGALIAECMQKNGWIRCVDGKEYELTEEGVKGLEKLGIKS